MPHTQQDGNASTSPRELTYVPEMEQIIGDLTVHTAGLAQAPSMDTRCWQERHPAKLSPGSKGATSTSFTSTAHLMQSASHGSNSGRPIGITALHSDRHAVVAGYEDGSVEVTYYQRADDGSTATAHKVITPTELDADFHKTEDTSPLPKSGQAKEKETAAQRHNPVVAVHGMQLEEDSYLFGVAYKDRVYVVVAPFAPRSTAVTLHRRAPPQPVTFALTPAALTRLLAPPPPEGSSATVEHVVLSPCGQFAAVALAGDVPQVLVLALPLSQDGGHAAPPGSAQASADDASPSAPATVPLTGTHLRTRCHLPRFAAGAAPKDDPPHASCHFLLGEDDTAGMLLVAWTGTSCYMRLLLRPSLARARLLSTLDKPKAAEEPAPRGESRRGKELTAAARPTTGAHAVGKSERESNVAAALAKDNATPLFISSRIQRAVVTPDFHYVVLGCAEGCAYVMDRRGVMAVAGGPPPSLPLPAYGEAPKTELTVLTAAVGRRGASAADGSAEAEEEVRIVLGATHTRGEVRCYTATYLAVTAEDVRGAPRYLVNLPTAATAACAPTALPFVVLSFGALTLLWDVCYHDIVGGLPVCVHHLSDLSDDGDNLLWVEGGATVLDTDARPSRWPLQALLRAVYPLLSTYFPLAPLDDLGALLRRATPAQRVTAALGKVRVEAAVQQVAAPAGRRGTQRREEYVLQRAAELQAGAPGRQAWLQQLLA